MIRSVTHRIAIWYGALFTLLFLMLFVLIYRDFSKYLVQRTDDLLIEKALRNEWYSNDVPLSKIQYSIAHNTEIEGSQMVAYWLYNTEGELLYGPTSETWKGLTIDSNLIRDVSRSGSMQKWELKNRFSEMRIHWFGKKSKLGLGFFESGKMEHLSYRAGYIRLGDGKVLVCANNMTRVDSFLKRFIRSFIVLFLVAVIVGSSVGYFLAFKAMSGVKRVTRVASGITDGNLHDRVHVNSDGVEIQDLASAFNNMLDRIQNLLVGLKQVSDDIAHDLRTPVTRIRTLAEMNATSSKDAECRCQMGVIVEECDLLIEMINTMLEIAQTNSGVIQFEMVDLNLSELLQSGFELFQIMAEDKSLEFEFENKLGAIEMKGNKSRLQRVISNLLDNAIKFTPEGGRVRMEVVEAKQGIKVEICDTGIGIPEELQERIFDRFYRRDPSRAIEGNGLGLCLARAILRAHGGDVIVESVEGEGSCFRIELPITTG